MVLKLYIDGSHMLSVVIGVSDVPTNRIIIPVVMSLSKHRVKCRIRHSTLTIGQQLDFDLQW